uniref:C2H2-type domain-containing protein n=1 Tax=Rhabditophanes sp. KR3021 TaxID=114890 RepID=A0AC35U2R2_9BILA
MNTRAILFLLNKSNTSYFNLTSCRNPSYGFHSKSFKWSFSTFSPARGDGYCANELYCTHCKLTFDRRRTHSMHIRHRQCQQLRDAEQTFNQEFNARDVLDVIWPERNDPSAANDAYIYFFLDPRAD